MSLVLSVIVISHNQLSQIGRCLDSILSQNLTFDYEIIISDDFSTDGTWEIEQDYSARYPFIKCFRCNSDDCNPTITSERSGYNRYNAYIHSSGKYFVHIDADDWYRPGTECLSRQVELLEQHPECSMCMQDEWCWNEGDSIEQGHANHLLHRFPTGYVLSAEEYYKRDILANNGVMMIRRQEGREPSISLRKWYVDNFITAYYLQFGPIVCLDLNDWIYSQTSTTITNSIKVNDRMLLWGLDSTVFIAHKIPYATKLVYSSPFSRSMLLDSVRIILKKTIVSKSITDFCAQFDDVFIFRAAAKKSLSLIDRLRLNVIRLLLKHCYGRSLDSNSVRINLINSFCSK